MKTRSCKGARFGAQLRRASLGLALVSAAACSRNRADDYDIYGDREPIPVHVRNDNYLDMNVYAVIGGSRRRLGTVTGNTDGEFEISWSTTTGQPVTITAQPIGGRGAASTGALNIGYGQGIFFRIASVLQQSTASLYQP